MILDVSFYNLLILFQLPILEHFVRAYSILKKICSFNNTLSITTTHYTDLEILEKDTKGKIVNYKFEVDYNKDKASQYSVSSVPTIIIEKDGQIVNRFSGVKPKMAIISLINQYK